MIRDERPSDSRPRLSVCIIACKDLSLNVRVLRQAKALAEAGHSATVIAFNTPDTRLMQADGVTLMATGEPPFPALLLANLWSTAHVLRDEARLQRQAAAAVAAGQSRVGRFAQRAATQLAGRSFDLVQAHFDKALTAAALLASCNGANLVFDAVEVPFDQELIPPTPVNRSLRLAEIRQEMEIAERSNGWITVNDSLADAAVERFAIARPLVLRNCQNQGPWSSNGGLRRDMGLGDDARILLHLNTMRRGEGLETVIDALAQLPTNVHLVALGPTPERRFLSRMRRRAAERAVADRFHVAPLQPPHTVLQYIAGADIGIIARQGTLQNFRLSLPNRLFQLIAARLPVIATPIREIARIVQEWDVGLLFDEGESGSLAMAIRTMLDPSAMARFRVAVDRAAGVLTWERECAPYVDFIERAAAAKQADRPPDSVEGIRMRAEQIGERSRFRGPVPQ